MMFLRLAFGIAHQTQRGFAASRYCLSAALSWASARLRIGFVDGDKESPESIESAGRVVVLVETESPNCFWFSMHTSVPAFTLPV